MSQSSPVEMHARLSGHGGKSRRDTLGLLLWGSLGAIALPALYVVARYLAPPSAAAATAVAGPDSGIRTESPRIIRVGLKDAIVMRRDDSGLAAFSLTCTHAGCNVEWRPAERQFFCPCHQGVFAEDGQVVKGPPRRALERLQVEVDQGIVKVTDMPLER